MCYDFNISIGDQVLKVNKHIRHIIGRMYKSDYIGSSVLDQKDEQVLAWSLSNKLNDKLMAKIENIKNTLMKRKIKESKAKGHRDEWLEFHDEDNVYEETILNMPEEYDAQENSQANENASQIEESPQTIDSYRMQFKDDMPDNESMIIKATIEPQLYDESPPRGVHENIEFDTDPSEEDIDGEEDGGDDQEDDGNDGEVEDKAIEAQLSNRYHSKINPTVQDKEMQMRTMESPINTTRSHIRQPGDAIKSLKNKIHLNKLYLQKE
jgi:hypothetical protein